MKINTALEEKVAFFVHLVYCWKRRLYINLHKINLEKAAPSHEVFSSIYLNIYIISVLESFDTHLFSEFIVIIMVHKCHDSIFSPKKTSSSVCFCLITVPNSDCLSNWALPTEHSHMYHYAQEIACKTASYYLPDAVHSFPFTFN